MKKTTKVRTNRRSQVENNKGFKYTGRQLVGIVGNCRWLVRYFLCRQGGKGKGGKGKGGKGKKGATKARVESH
eukprot:64524-Amphidinium_carterae.1